MEKSNESNNEIQTWLLEVEEPLNITDPFVVHDPELSKPGIVKNYVSSETGNTDVEKVKYDGVSVPLVDLNGTNLTEDQIESLTIFYNDFTPKMTLIVDDPARKTQFIGGPGLHNIVTVILTCPTDGMYKKITIPFYIKEINNLSDSKIQYDCEYWNINLNKILMGQIGEDKLTTYQFCEEISKGLKIGFAATEKCQDIADAKWRQSYSQRIKDFISDQVKCGGVDENSVFDCWIDLFGYLVLVNFSYVIHEQVDIKNYSILTAPGIKPTFTQDETNQPIQVKRVICNNDGFPFTSLKISKTYNNLYTHNTQNNGALKTFWILNNAGDQNLLEKKQIQMIEESVEGVSFSQTYESQNTEFLGAEMADDTPALFQLHVRNMCFLKYRSRQLTVELEEANYGIQRGTLIYVIVTEDDIEKKQLIQTNGDGISSSNVISKMEELSGDENASIIPSTDTEPVDFNQLGDQESWMVNPALSGFYYVDSMSFSFTGGDNIIKETLYLIKKDVQSSMVNTANSIKIPNSVIDKYEDEAE